VEAADAEAKLSKLKSLLHCEGFFDHTDQRLLLFTEFKDTLDYLVGKLKTWGFKVGCIHGGMKPGSRNDPGTRLYSEQQFRDGAIQEPVKDPARFTWREVTKVAHYWLEVNAMTQPMLVREDQDSFGVPRK
jgi:hypothetical protein